MFKHFKMYKSNCKIFNNHLTDDNETEPTKVQHSSNSFLVTESKQEDVILVD